MYLAAGNPFISAYLQSDWFGKAIFLGLFGLSMLSWWVLVHKAWIFFSVRRLSSQFRELFSEKDPLGLQWNRPLKLRLLEIPHPFFEVYKALKQHALQIISRNHFLIPHTQSAELSEADLGIIESQVYAAMSSESKKLEKNLFVLSTTATLAPFLGLLGTVWGLLVAFSQLEQKASGISNASMLAGLALALTTTVLGLVIAIPAFVGYNYLKNAAREYRRELENFSHLLLSSLELYYRKPDHAKTPNTAP